MAQVPTLTISPASQAILNNEQLWPLVEFHSSNLAVRIRALSFDTIPFAPTVCSEKHAERSRSPRPSRPTLAVASPPPSGAASHRTRDVSRERGHRSAHSIDVEANWSQRQLAALAVLGLSVEDARTMGIDVTKGCSNSANVDAALSEPHKTDEDPKKTTALYANACERRAYIVALIDVAFPTFGHFAVYLSAPTEFTFCIHKALVHAWYNAM